LLLPGPAGGDEDDLVESEDALDLGGCDEVAVMDRIEGPAHHADPSPLLLHAPQRSGSMREVVSRLRCCAPPVSQVRPSSAIRIRNVPMPMTGALRPSLAAAPDSARIRSWSVMFWGAFPRVT